MFLSSDTSTSMTQSPPTKESNFSAQCIMSLQLLQLFALDYLALPPQKSGFLDYYING